MIDLTKKNLDLDMHEVMVVGQGVLLKLTDKQKANITECFFVGGNWLRPNKFHRLLMKLHIIPNSIYFIEPRKYKQAIEIVSNKK